MKVALYLRYSSHNQTEQSIEGQDRVCTEYCNREGHIIVKRYIDRATTASKDTEKRTEFLQMIEDSEKKMFDAVLVYKLDRFSRNRYDSAIYKSKLAENGVQLISATEAIGNTPESVILESVLEGVAEYYSKELSQKVKRGMRETQLKNMTTGGRPPLGYKVVDRHLAVDEQSAPIVRIIFDKYASGDSIVSIVKWLNNHGYKTAWGNKFTKTSFNRIFDNRVYIGENHGQQDAVPAIVDKDVFDMVQERIKNRKRIHKHGGKVDYMLTGKLFCGHCGRAMSGVSGTSGNGETHYYYVCYNSRKHVCDKKAVRKEYLEEAVTKYVYSLLNPTMIRQIAKAAVEQAEKDPLHNGNVKELQERRSELITKLNNLTMSLSLGVLSPTVIDSINKYEAEKNNIDELILSAEAQVFHLDEDGIVLWLNKFLQGDIKDPKFASKLIRILVNRITLWDDPNGFRIRLELNLEGPPVDVRLQDTMDHHKGESRTTFAIEIIIPRK